MVNTAVIETNLQELKHLYDSTSNPLHMQFYCKLAVLECSSWVETSFDEIAKDYISRKVNDPANQNILLGRVSKFYSVTYADTRMLMSTILGMENLETVEGLIENNDFINMKSSIGTIKAMRDTAAHVPLGMALRSYSSPHTVWTNYQSIKKGIQAFETCVAML